MVCNRLQVYSAERNIWNFSPEMACSRAHSRRNRDAARHLHSDSRNRRTARLHRPMPVQSSILIRHRRKPPILPPQALICSFSLQILTWSTMVMFTKLSVEINDASETAGIRNRFDRHTPVKQKFRRTTEPCTNQIFHRADTEHGTINHRKSWRTYVNPLRHFRNRPIPSVIPLHILPQSAKQRSAINPQLHRTGLFRFIQ